MQRKPFGFVRFFHIASFGSSSSIRLLKLVMQSALPRAKKIIEQQRAHTHTHTQSRKISIIFQLSFGHVAQALNILLCALFSRIFHRTRTMSFCQKIIIFPPTLTAYHIAILAVVLNISCASDIFFFYIYIYIFYVRLTSPIFPCAHGVFRFSHSPNIFLELKVKWHKSCSILFRFLPAPFSFSGSYCGGPRVK